MTIATIARALIIFALCAVAAFAGDFITPEITGPTDADSIIVTITVVDTTLLPTVADADSLYVIRFAPDGSLIDSIELGAANIFSLRTGWYEAHFKAPSADTQLGIYSVYTKAHVGGDWRGHVAGCYLVQANTIGTVAISIDSLLYLQELASYVLGTCDDCIIVYSPNDGTEHKDGYEVWANGEKKISVYFGHSNVVSSLDTVKVEQQY